MTNFIPKGWKAMPPKANKEMVRAMVAAEREYMKENGGNNPWLMYEAAFAAAPEAEGEIANRLEAGQAADPTAGGVAGFCESLAAKGLVLSDLAPFDIPASEDAA